MEQAQRFHQQVMKEQQIASVLTIADKKIKTLKQKTDCLKQEKRALMQQRLTTNGESRWASMVGRTLNMFLSRLVEPLRLFHPTQLTSGEL
ncbi:MAG: hypothetical protein L3J98_12730 [Gammaproteobacteria bacterium]|nr:hypothetical protein [Gammaproteobacteria bacterium]MCF6261002.1 hypothetical protein [Gammaproteobacteria bacterium]